MIFIELVLEDDDDFTAETFQAEIASALAEKDWVVVGEQLIFHVKAVRVRKATIDQLEKEAQYVMVRE